MPADRGGGRDLAGQCFGSGAPAGERVMMPGRPRLHVPSIVGRMRTDPGPLVLMAVVVALTTSLLRIVRRATS